MTFPGMFRLYDFHSNKAPRLKNARSFTFFAPDSDEEDEDEEFCPDPSAYSHFFKVTVNGDDIYIEDPLEPNSSGKQSLFSFNASLISRGFLRIRLDTPSYLLYEFINCQRWTRVN
jgi:hypothetical protein